MDTITYQLKHPEFLAGGGEMGERIRNFDWSKTPLGRPEQWDQSLKTCVRIMLTSSQPIWIGWGKELIKLYNDPYKAIVGGKHPHALGLPASLVWKDIWTDIAPMLKKVMEENEGTYVESQLLIMERYGYPEETYYTFSYSPVPGVDGKTAGMICYNTAETERIINERSLQTLRELGTLTKKKNLEDVYESAVKILELNNKDFPFAIISQVNDEGTSAFPFAMAGIDKDHPELPGTIDLKNPKEKGKHLAVAVLENKLYYFENSGNWKDLPPGAWNIPPKAFVHVPIKAGNKKHAIAVLTVALNPYRQFDDTYRNFIQLVADQVSLEVNTVLAYEEERKRAEALAEIDKAKTVFFSNISHEFRTPLTLMLGPLEELLGRSNSSLTAIEKQNIETTHRNAMRLLKLVNSLLDFSRIEAGRQQAIFSLVDIAALTKNLASNFRSIIEKAGLELIIRAETFIQPVYLDKQMWEKIVFNLLSNAFKYTFKGSITVDLGAEENMAVLKVRDTGVGIPEKELPHIFERFHRVENAEGRTYEGTGIGLSLVKELIQLHEGSISAESKTGEGSTFIVKIPFGKDHVSSHNVKEAEKEFAEITSSIYVDEASYLLEEGTGKSHIDEIHLDGNVSLPLVMVVDDNADMREHIQSLLSGNFSIITANNGLDALQKLRDKQPVLIISDIMMPILDGIGLLREVKSNKSTAQIPVILLTARAGEESKIEGWQTGADDYLIKPFSSKELIARVHANIKNANLQKASLQNLEKVFKYSPVEITVMRGSPLRYEQVNDTALQAWGKSGEEVIGKTLYEVFPELKGLGIAETMEEVLRTNKPYVAIESPIEIVYSGERKLHYFNYVVQTFKNENDNIAGIMTTGIDVTENVLARQQIADSEKRYNMMLMQSPFAFAIFKGKDMVIDLANDSMKKVLGKGNDIEGKSLFKVLPELAGQAFTGYLENVFKTGTPFYANDALARLHRNGRLEDVYFNFVYQPYREVDGSISGVTCIAYEVTNEVKAKRIVEENEKQLNELANAVPQLVWMADATGNVTYYNDRVSEFAGAEKLPDGSWKWEGLLYPADLIPTEEAWRKAVATGTAYEIEHRVKMKEGFYRWFLSRAYPQKNNEGYITKWFGTATDIDDQKSHEARKDDFIKMASHELKTPVTTMKGYFQMLQEKFKDTDEVVLQHSLPILDRQINKLTKLISDLLDVTRIESGRLVLDKTVFCLNDLVRETADDMKTLSKRHTINFVEAARVNVFADRERIMQVLINLLTNAIKYSPDAHEIRILMKKENDKVIAGIQDYGIGIETGEQKKIFENFYRVKGKDEQTYPGFGIGLFIVSEILQQHEGKVWVESEKGKGSTFYFSLPLHK